MFRRCSPRARSVLARLARLALCLSLTTAALAPLASTASAQTSEEDKALAQELYNRASESYSQGDYEQSIEWLERAYELDPDPVILYNLGRSYEGDAQLDKAEELLTRVEADPNTPEELRKRSRTDLKRIANLKAGTLQQGQLTVTTSPDKARLFIDGRVEGTTPFAAALPVGQHTILVQKDGYESVEQTVNILKNETAALDLTMLSLTGGLDEPMDTTPLYIGAGVALGLGAIGIGTGIGTALAAQDIHDTYCTLPDGKCIDNDELETGRTLATVSVASYVVGGVGLAAGAGLLIWALVEDAGSETNAAAAAEPSLRPTAMGYAPRANTLTLGWTW